MITPARRTTELIQKLVHVLKSSLRRINTPTENGNVITTKSALFDRLMRYGRSNCGCENRIRTAAHISTSDANAEEVLIQNQPFLPVGIRLWSFLPHKVPNSQTMMKKSLSIDTTTTLVPT
ncbi:unnamed protein product [Albugo candida]|uniref:Uncharacterized protein n=1 Tax=Albugo candida TaxID=65357 RepID=A0A024GTH7_9STRA|nr:unnamed protein product [Albugo candida]|eukprot:CCI50007.1 unnamed protein product [Albugo candida]